MHTEILVGNKIEEGRRLIETLDQSGLSPKIAFWYYAPAREEWRLAMSIPIVDRIGSLKGYGKIASVMKKLRPPLGMYLSDIHLEDSSGRVVSAVKAAVRPKKRAVDAFKNINRYADAEYIQDAYVYRIQ